MVMVAAAAAAAVVAPFDPAPSTWQVALGIYYLHCCRPAVLHLDLKSANVLLDDYGRAKVCDFGLAHLKEEHGVLTSRMGSPMWTAPEILKGEAATETADSYSFAMLLYEIISRRLPYVGIPAPQAPAPPPLPHDAARAPRVYCATWRRRSSWA